MAITVTATEGANSVNGILLRVRVLTGAAAAAAQPGGIKQADTSTTPFYDQPVTTTQAGSVVYGAMADGNTAFVMTPDARTTLIDNFSDSTQGCQYVSWRATAATGTPGATTLGATSPAGGEHGTYAAAEILSATGAITEDGSAPAVATSVSAKTVTTASFSPPVGSLLVAMAACCSSAATTVTITTAGLTWRQVAFESTAAGTASGVWVADVPAPPLARIQNTYAPGWHPGRAPGTAFGGTPFYVQPNNDFPPPVPVPLADSGTGTDTLTFIPVVPLADSGTGTDALALGTITITLTDSGTGTDAMGPRVIAGLGGTGAGYFADQFGQPRMVLGDAAWGLPCNAGRWSSGAWQADFDAYFATRGSQGFTVLYTEPMGTVHVGGINDDARTFDGLVPFQGGSLGNPSSGLTAAYWARIDYMLASAAAQGITVFMNAIGYNSDFQSNGPLAGKSATEFGAFGTALGGRYKNTPNLIWMVADDYFGGSDTEISAFLTGLRGAGDSHPIAIENYAESTSRADLPGGTPPAWGLANAQFNFCYSYNVTYFGIEKAYLETLPVTVIQGDGYFYQGDSVYQGGTGAFAFDRGVRQDAWHALSSGARGYIVGDEATWQWNSTAQASAAVAWFHQNNTANIRTLMESLPGWHLLVPDTSSALVTSGRGTHATGFSSGGGGGQYEVATTDSYVTASLVPDGSLAVIYMSHAGTIGIDQTKMASGYTAWWVDPVTGAKTSTTAGSSYNSTAKGNNSRGEADWVLVLQGAASTPVALSDSGSGSDTVTAVTSAVPLTDAGAGADVLAVTIPVALADSGTGADVLAVAVPVALTDAGSGADIFAQQSAAVPLTDSGSGSDTLAPGSPAVTLGDSGTGADVLAISQPTALTDAGSGADTLAVTLPAALADAGSGTDVLLLTTPVPLTDAGSGTETLTLTSAVPLADSGSGADSLNANGNQSFPLTDSGTGSDVMAVTAAVPFADAGTGADALAVTIPVALADSGTGSDSLVQSSAQPVALTDSGTGSDTFALGAITIAIADSGTGSDVLALTSLTVGLGDAGSAADSLLVTRAVSLSDLGTAADTFNLALLKALTDSGTGTDTLVQSVPPAIVPANSTSVVFAENPGTAFPATAQNASTSSVYNIRGGIPTVT